MGSGGTTALGAASKFLCSVLSDGGVGRSCERQSHTLYAPSVAAFCRLVPSVKSFGPESELKIVVFLQSAKTSSARCKVKPHGSQYRLPTHRCAIIPGLSTSSSSTFLQETLSPGELIFGALCLDAFSTYSSAFSYRAQCHWHDKPEHQ